MYTYLRTLLITLVPLLIEYLLILVSQVNRALVSLYPEYIRTPYSNTFFETVKNPMKNPAFG